MAANCFEKKSVEHGSAVSNKPQGFISSHKDLGKKIKGQIREEYEPFVSNGSVCPVDDPTKRVKIKILRDTGATQSLIVEEDMPRGSETTTGERVVIQGVGSNFVSVQLHRISLDSNIVCGPIVIGVVDSLPMKGISMLLGNDLARERVVPHPRVVEKLSVLEETEKIEETHPGTFPSCLVTRANARKRAEETSARMESENEGNEVVDPSQTCLGHEIGSNPMLEQTPSSPNPREETTDVMPIIEMSMVTEQREDSQIAPLFEETLPEEELNKVP